MANFSVRSYLLTISCLTFAGVKEIMFDTSTQKVVVIGHLDVQLEPSMVLNAVKKVKNRAELWKPSKNS